MDQLKAILKQLQKHHFWLLGTLAIIIGMVGWSMAAGKLSDEYTKEKSQILAEFSSMQSLRGEEKPKNMKWKEGIAKLADEERKKVRKAWELVYNEQKKLLDWPTELQSDFLEFVNNKPQDAEIRPELCERYLTLIKQTELPKLLEIIDAAPRPQTTGSRPGAAQKPNEPAREYSVIWDAASQEDLEKLLEWPKTPSSNEVRRAQEDLWVYKALLTSIHATNKGQHVPRVKRIVALSIGKPAAIAFEQGMAPNQIEHLTTAEAAQPAGATQAAQGKTDGEGPAWDEGRYVDSEGKALGTGVAAQEQFKRIPVHIKAVMDQREIAKLLIELANSPLPLEVRQLRVNPGGKVQSASDRNSSSAKTSESFTFDLPVEIHGIIYMFNRPDMSKLGGDQSAEPAPTSSAGT